MRRTIGPVYEYLLTCDKCGADGYERNTSEGYETLSYFECRRREQGWILGKLDLCPECSGKIKGDER